MSYREEIKALVDSLNPCPRPECGEKADLMECSSGFYVKCSACSYSNESFWDKYEACDDWNKMQEVSGG